MNERKTRKKNTNQNIDSKQKKYTPMRHSGFFLLYYCRFRSVLSKICIAVARHAIIHHWTVYRTLIYAIRFRFYSIDDGQRTADTGVTKTSNSFRMGRHSTKYMHRMVAKWIQWLPLRHRHYLPLARCHFCADAPSHSTIFGSPSQ